MAYPEAKAHDWLAKVGKHSCLYEAKNEAIVAPELELFLVQKNTDPVFHCSRPWPFVRPETANNPILLIGEEAIRFSIDVYDAEEWPGFGSSDSHRRGAA